MWVYVLNDPKPITKTKPGPLHGVTTKYLTKHGFPVAEREPDPSWGTTFRPVRAESGMVVIDAIYGYNLYHIDINGDAHALNVQVSPVQHEFPEVAKDEIEVDNLSGALRHQIENHIT